MNNLFLFIIHKQIGIHGYMDIFIQYPIYQKNQKPNYIIDLQSN